ncbi:[LSU ribosomal protein L11P]-lysine N-methyltransferase [Malonomonas rubra DSM 5091]|uniref:Ribosomal protein L11 methyltransferase n=1 Tax=Malonomonas rubra DSM 5091 TaxID=1122189 RepID=A0A1M6FH78_MALRU|nr:50S ribosomal protein L11 methyltransferase [Malonomonas rubra]SHI96962.1 [LSU ribosomal protein L11P]-lysine N-methyltransferase [Malonomonas rubra DSM 5091]
MDNEWVVIEIDMPGRWVELAGAVVAELGAGGTVVEERQLDTFVVPDEDLDPEKSYCLKVYFEEIANISSLKETIEQELAELPALLAEQFNVSEPKQVHMEDWAENWKQNFSTMRIGSRLVIHPSWEDYQTENGEVAIEIDPGMAFGTGTHGTTMLCLKTIADLLAADNPPSDMLDVGTGSGILALGAAALGCPKILANDIDPLACRVATENVVKNGYQDCIEISSQPLEELPGEYDLLVANILAEENIRLKNDFLEHLRPGGWLVLSGILREKESLVRQGFADLPLESYPTEFQDEWICLLYRRK